MLDPIRGNRLSVNTVWVWLIWVPLTIGWIVATPPSMAQTQSWPSEESAQRLIGSWRSGNRGKISVKTFGADGTYTEVTSLMVARATVTGIYRLEGQQLWWVEQRLTINRAGGDVLPPTRHVRLNEEQRVKIKWKGADEFVILSDRAVVYRRMRP